MHEFFYSYGMFMFYATIAVIILHICIYFRNIKSRQDILSDNLEALKLRVGRLESKNRSDG